MLFTSIGNGAGVRNIFSQLRTYSVGYLGGIIDSCQHYLESRFITESRPKKKEETTPANKHDTAFMTEINNCISYASEHNSKLSCIMVDFRDEYAITEFFALMKEAYHGNNGCYPSNEMRRVGKGQIGALIHAPAKEVGFALEDVVHKFAKLLQINSNIKFRAGVAAYEPGYDREKLMKEAQNYVDIELSKSNEPQLQKNYQELMKTHGPEATAKRMNLNCDKQIAAVA